MKTKFVCFKHWNYKMIEIVNQNGKYKYYKLQYYRTKHLSTINKGTKKTYSVISEYDITSDDINIYNSKINSITLDNIVQYTKDRKIRIDLIIDKYKKNKSLKTDDCVYLLKIYKLLYKLKYEEIIDNLYEDIIVKEDIMKLYSKYLKDELV